MSVYSVKVFCICSIIKLTAGSLMIKIFNVFSVANIRSISFMYRQTLFSVTVTAMGGISATFSKQQVICELRTCSNWWHNSVSQNCNAGMSKRQRVAFLCYRASLVISHFKGQGRIQKVNLESERKVGLCFLSWRNRGLQLLSKLCSKFTIFCAPC